MRTLIVDDDFTNRRILQELLKDYGPSHIAVNGKEAVEAVRLARAGKEPYDLICLDVIMPKMDGHEALRSIRADEEAAGIMRGDGVKVIMTTALGDGKNVVESFKESCDAYLVKPVVWNKLLEKLRELGLSD